MEATIGGTRRHLNQLAIGLPKDKYDITVVASAERDPTFRNDMADMAAAGARVIELPMVRNIQFKTDSAHLRRLREILREGKFDVVHTHSSKAGALGRWASIRERVGKRVHTAHTFGFAFAGGFSLPKRAMFYGIELFLGRFTHRLICVSPSELQQALSLHVAPRGSIRMIENGIDTKAFQSLPAREVARARCRLPAGRPVALIVALQNPAKGQLEAIEALAQVPARCRPLLALAGGVSDPEYGGAVAARIQQLHLENDVLQAGHQSNIPEWLAAADFVVCPSRWEGMPYAVLEAMAASRAVLATATNGARDAIVDGSTGRLVACGDVAALAQGMVEFTENPSRCEAMGLAGRRRVLEHYTADRMITKTMQLYDEVVAP